MGHILTGWTPWQTLHRVDPTGKILLQIRGLTIVLSPSQDFFTHMEMSPLPNYGYTFNVTSVTKCPLNKEEWDAASDRLNCTETQGYHCVPDKYMTSLVEFCYTRGKKFPFHKGNCLELAADGILNHFPCAKTFPCGCPDSFYFSNEIYKYPKCLQINTQLECFESDIQCMITKALDHTTNLTNEAIVVNFSTNCQDTNIQLIVTGPSNDTSVNTYKPIQYERENRECASCEIHVVFIVILALLFVGSLVLSGWLYFRQRQMKKNTAQQQIDMTRQPLLPSSTSSHENSESTHPHDMIRQPLLPSSTSSHANSESTHPHDEAFSDLARACRNGDKAKYHSLTAPETFDKSLLIKKDNRGRTVLHHAVYGGSYDIVYDLLKFKEVDVCERENIGRTALHLAAQGDNVEIFNTVLQKVGNSLLQSKDKNELTPFCYAALAGKKTVIESIVEKGFNIEKLTKYGESIAHLACIGGSLEILKMVSEKESKRGSLNTEHEEEEEDIIKRKNKMDWNPLQYAAKSGNTNILKFLIENNVRLINSTEDLKSAFHSACENGHLEACTYIARYRPECVHTTDNRGRHAGHFIAKCGNVNILKILIDECKLLADNPSSQKINILHIACRHGRFDMCVYIAENYPHLVTQESKKGWNAALFLSEKGGADEERLKILQFLVSKCKLFVYHVSRAGKTILYNACANRSQRFCRYLLENYPDLLTIERCMDPRNVTSDPEIIGLIETHSKEE
ncbi:uncharacterized protein LOC125653811 isoform X3 [Ostrea edulis]|uniref:uncharacterized protein LOC125653811 isoform X3 n=2 Tax=Ostrea edulis TaxID=37623 RepID=UPI0024AFBF72|nr:uncharacterized protein LOC125653811 isoform X3 [Ostrea edulis]XP_055999356.1 uncharacterized protein LOC125653811 isoform X3 [Ostrea edulis]XP_055999357.1 uncharacterized protein LOC125653811 isoform X3 [Ostrea edulis]XP_055999358.1 uncharacterized protein LOC125653811 isoform X3 [Ostrea edulis]